jgi:hypothetical protein
LLRSLLLLILSLFTARFALWLSSSSRILICLSAHLGLLLFRLALLLPLNDRLAAPCIFLRLQLLAHSFSLCPLRFSFILGLCRAGLFLRSCFRLAIITLLSTLITPLLAFELPQLATSFFITFGRFVFKRCHALISLLILAGLCCRLVCLAM